MPLSASDRYLELDTRGKAICQRWGVEIMNYYASWTAIQQARRRQLLYHHPDKNGGSNDAFQQLSDEYDYLKALYDLPVATNDNAYVSSSDSALNQRIDALFVKLDARDKWISDKIKTYDELIEEAEEFNRKVNELLEEEEKWEADHAQWKAEQKKKEAKYAQWEAEEEEMDAKYAQWVAEEEEMDAKYAQWVAEEEEMDAKYAQWEAEEEEIDAEHAQWVAEQKEIDAEHAQWVAEQKKKAEEERQYIEDEEKLIAEEWAFVHALERACAARKAQEEKKSQYQPATAVKQIETPVGVAENFSKESTAIDKATYPLTDELPIEKHTNTLMPALTGLCSTLVIAGAVGITCTFAVPAVFSVTLPFVAMLAALTTSILLLGYGLSGLLALAISSCNQGQSDTTLRQEQQFLLLDEESSDNFVKEKQTRMSNNELIDEIHTCSWAAAKPSVATNNGLIGNNGLFGVQRCLSNFKELEEDVSQSLSKNHSKR